METVPDGEYTDEFFQVFFGVAGKLSKRDRVSIVLIDSGSCLKVILKTGEVYVVYVDPNNSTLAETLFSNIQQSVEAA